MCSRGSNVKDDVQVRVSDWTDVPGARYPKDGPFSGQEYRETVLVPAFKRAMESGVMLEVDLDNTQGYATSFLEEAFGGLAEQFGAEVVERWLRLSSFDEPYLVTEITGYIRNAIGGRVRELEMDKGKISK